MKCVYVTEPGAVARREGSKLVIFTADRRRIDIPCFDVDQVVFVGNVVVTPAAFDLLLERGADIVLLSSSGRFRGRVVTGVSKNVTLRLRQYDLLRDARASCEFARTIVRGKIDGQRVVLQRHIRRHGTTEPLRRACISLRASALRVEMQPGLDELRGCEGAAAAAYFAVFGKLVRVEGLVFNGRSRRPPLDPVNALLSFGYTLLARHVEAAIEVVGLDPYVAALHAASAGRPSLVCDLMEEYRAAIVDPFVLAVINNGALGPKDFKEDGPGGGVSMTPEALRWFIRLFERRLARPVLYAPTATKLPWREVILQQTRRFARHVLGQEIYAPLEPR